MPGYKRKDHYYTKAKDEGLTNRAVFKIREIQQKFNLIHSGDVVVDLGCSPGGWLLEMAGWIGTSGRLVGVDIEKPDVGLPRRAQFILGDIEEESTLAAIRDAITMADVVVSDIAPHTSGVKFVDRLRSERLVELAYDTAQQILKPGGHFVAKVLPGAGLDTILKQLRGDFTKVAQFVPDSTRKSSVERYLVATGYKKGLD